MNIQRHLITVQCSAFNLNSLVRPNLGQVFFTYPTGVLAVKLSRTREKDSSRRHVKSHSKCFSGKESFDETFSEKNFSCFLEDGQKSSVMDADSTFQEWQNIFDLRQGPVLLWQDLHRILKDLVDQSLLVRWKKRSNIIVIFSRQWMKICNFMAASFRQTTDLKPLGMNKKLFW